MPKLAVIGAGESGIGAALLAKAKAYEVFVSDFGKIKEAFKAELIENEIPFEEGGHDIERITDCDIVVKSPGVSPETPLIKHLTANGKQIISEIEFASRFTKAKIIGITGSNGKTTSTALTYHLLHHAGLNVCMAGNIGPGFARAVINDQYDVFVLELSSFQLDDIDTFKADIAVLLNITPDHLDRYDYNFEKYVQSKFRIMMNQGREDVCILNDLDPTVGTEWSKNSGIQEIILLSRDTFSSETLSTDNGQNFDISTFSLKGRHNQLNTLCAIHVAQCMGIDSKTIQSGLAGFRNLTHRMEPAGELNGVRFINDSKATNVDAVYFALDAMTSPVIWIAGGTDKGNDYTALYPKVEGRVKCLICLGIDNEKLKNAFMGLIADIKETRDIKEAVDLAYTIAEDGDVVLLSPACASFDLFNNYEHRGNAFKEAVSEKIKLGTWH